MLKHKIVTMKIAELNPAGYNPRTISKQALKGLTASLDKFGVVQPIIWNRKTGNVVGGHQRLKVLQAAGEKETPVVVVDLNDTDEKALNITLNNPHIEGQFTDGLQPLLQDIQNALPELFLNLGLDQLAITKENPDAKDPDDIPPPSSRKTAIKPGDLFELGDHRLLCGDSTKKQNVERLMGDAEISCVFTDPPYGVSYEARSGKFAVIKGDDLRDDGLTKLLTPALAHAVNLAADKAAFYIWHASSTREDFVYAMRAAGLIERQYLIWAKSGFALGYSDYRWMHEPCFYASRPDKKPAFYGDLTQSTIWRATLVKRGAVATTLGTGFLLTDGDGNRLYLNPKPPANKKLRQARLEKGGSILVSSLDSAGTVWEVSRDSNAEHPTQKPVELATRAIENSSKEGEIIYDPFMGSGTTLIGAEMRGRKARGCELDPRYVDVILRRWERFTGKKAKKV